MSHWMAGGRWQGRLRELAARAGQAASVAALAVVLGLQVSGQEPLRQAWKPQECGGSSVTEPERKEEERETADWQEPVREELEIVWQLPEMPNGCEIASLAMVLNWAGTEADKMELWENYVPALEVRATQNGLLGGDPEEYYIGDATSRNMGWYCFEEPLRETAEAFLDDRGVRFRVEASAGLGRSALESYLDQEIPVIVWVTQEYEAPELSERSWTMEDGSIYIPWSNLHCVVVYGRTGESYQVADPLRGFQSVESGRFWESFQSIGAHALVIW